MTTLEKYEAERDARLSGIRYIQLMMMGDRFFQAEKGLSTSDIYKRALSLLERYKVSLSSDQIARDPSLNLHVTLGDAKCATPTNQNVIITLSLYDDVLLKRNGKTFSTAVWSETKTVAGVRPDVILEEITHLCERFSVAWLAANQGKS
jgi:hypothetical protein